MLPNALIPLTLFICIAYAVSYILNRISLYKERIKAIENGANLSDLNFNTQESKNNSLRWGLIAIGFSIGCVVGAILENAQLLPNYQVGYFFAISLFTGIALVIFHILNQRSN